MNNPAAYQEILSALGDALGLELTFEDDLCNIEIESPNIGCCIRKLEDEGRIAIVGIIADEMPDEISYSLIQEFLETAINPLYNAGPTIALDPDTQHLIAYVTVNIADITPADFPEIIGEFFKFQLNYINKLNHLDESPEAQHILSPAEQIEAH